MNAPSAIFAAFIAALGWMPGPSRAEDGPLAAVIVFARGGADEGVAGRIERDLRNMFAHRHMLDESFPDVQVVETRFDVGNLSKGDIERARRHFNDAQRWLEKSDAEEAQEQLFRAERFYNKAIPYSSDPPLLLGIYYYYYLARLEAGQTREARDAYCAYVALARNLAGSAGPIEQFEPLADKCGATSLAGTAELQVTANIEGGHLFVDGRQSGLVGRDKPYTDPFIPAGPHLVEVRKPGYARWGTLANLKNGGSKQLRAHLTVARNRAEDFDPLAEIVFEGSDAYGEDYLADLFFQMSERFGVDVLVAGFLKPGTGNSLELDLLTSSDGGVDHQTYPVQTGPDAHGSALQSYWKDQFGESLDPTTAQPTVDRWAPTLFKVE